MAISEYDDLDGLAMGELVRSRQVSAGELLEEAIRRVEAVNPRINAVVRPLYEVAREMAARPLPDGPFAGVPFLLKDLGADLRGVPTTYGSRYLATVTAARDNTLVRRFRHAGVVFFGKTNTPEFGLMPYTEPALFGPTRNPWDLDRTPGGSSGGAAAAVAAGIAPLAHANDGGGSIRIPAACCGLFGLKPTRGRSPVGPDRSELWGGLAVDHVITRTVRDSAAMLDAISAPDPAARFFVPRPMRPFQQEVGRPAGRLRIAMTTRPHLSTNPIHPDCAAAVQFAAQVLAGLGHDVEDADPVGDAPGAAEDFLTVVAVELAAAAEETAALVGRKPRLGEIEPLSALTVMIGRQPSAVAFARARERLAQLARRVTTFFDTYDLLLSPALAAPPVAIGALRPHGLEAWAQKAVAASHLGLPLRIPGVVRASAKRIFDFAAFTPLANVTGQPSMNVPLFWNEAGLPIGTMFTGRFSEEATLFRLAAELESACPWRDSRPPVRAGGGEAAARRE